MEIQTTQDVQLVRQAVKGRWPVRDATRLKVVESIEKIIEKTPENEKDYQLQLLACRTLVSIDALNLKEQEITQPKHIVHTNMTLDELKVEIANKLKNLNLDGVNINDLQKLLEHKREGVL